MQYVEGFPKTMVHPSFTPAIISDAAIGTAQSYAGQPARFLPQMVHTPDEEADMRARGYLNPGEAPRQVHHAEYPKILRHPQYAPAVKATQRSVVVRNKDTGENEIKIVDVPAIEEQYPDKTVAGAEEEECWRHDGWAPAGEWDSAAFERAHSTPDVAYDPKEWPKWVPTGEVDKDGKPIAVLMEDPAAVPAAELARQAREYPKWVNGRKVENAADEAAIANGGFTPKEWTEAVALRNTTEAIIPGAPAPAHAPDDTQVPPPVLDVAALKAEILGELVPQIRDVIREALAPKDWRLGGESVTTTTQWHEKPAAPKSRRKVAGKSPRSAEERKALGERLAAGRKAARERRAEEATHGT